LSSAVSQSIEILDLEKLKSGFHHILALVESSENCSLRGLLVALSNWDIVYGKALSCSVFQTKCLNGLNTTNKFQLISIGLQKPNSALLFLFF